MRAAATFLIVVGSSLVVYPAATMPFIAKESGAKLVIINLTPHRRTLSRTSSSTPPPVMR